MNNLQTQTKTQTAKYLAFNLGANQFVVPALEVREIIAIQEITAIPQTSAHVRGVINLRGRLIPIVDLRARLGLETAPYNSRTCIVVAQNGTAVNGLVVDGVSDVVNLGSAEIQETPELGAGVRSEYTAGVADVRGKTSIILNLAGVLGIRYAKAIPLPTATAA